MRLFLTIFISMTVLCTTAQNHLPIGTWGYGFTPWQPVMSFPSYNQNNHHLQVRPFASLSAGYLFFNGGVSYVSAPVGLLVFRPLTNNWTAFGAATITPTAFSINSLYSAPISDPNHGGYPFSSGYGLGLSPAVQGGLIYTNDARTFSISGSVRFERNTYPVYPSSGVNSRKQ